MLRKCMPWTLTLILLFDFGCIHTPVLEHKMVQKPAPSVFFTEVANENLKTASVVYLPSKLPLEDFFTRLSYGEFSQAFKKFDLNYRGSNTNDGALRELIRNGFIPVYVQVENRGAKPLLISENNFVLTDGVARVHAINAADVPMEITKFSPEALAANTFNVGVVVVGMAALVVALVAIAGSCNGACNFNGFGNTPDFQSSPASGDSMVLNGLTKTTVIDYNAYLLSQKPLEPGHKTEGLLLFHMRNGIAWNEYHLALAEGGLN
jgi:hypothetical protein